MKFALSLILFVALVPLFITDAAAEANADAAQNVAELRARLADVQARENELQARARQLDEDLKPDNIERSLAGVGSTKPEELRELRRRQLTIERDSVRTQLNLLATSRERLESAMRTAESAAYQKSAESQPVALDQATVKPRGLSFGWVVGIPLAVGEILGLVILVVLAMKRTRQRAAIK